MKKNNISIIVPTRNEEKIIVENLTKIHTIISQSKLSNNFEIIVSDYSGDSTLKKVKDLRKKYKKIKYFSVSRRGIGAGLKLGIEKSKYPIVVFYPIDMAYDSRGILKMTEMVVQNRAALIFGSRRCKGAREKKPLNRRIFSGGYSILINFFLNVNIKDTQGVFALNKPKVKNVLHAITADDGFFQTELAIYGRKFRIPIIEVPVHQKEPKGRKSNINPLKEGYSLFKKVLKKYGEINTK